MACGVGNCASPNEGPGTGDAIPGDSQPGDAFTPPACLADGLDGEILSFNGWVLVEEEVANGHERTRWSAAFKSSASAGRPYNHDIRAWTTNSTSSAGPCTLYGEERPTAPRCDPACEPDEYCVRSVEEAVCQPRPAIGSLDVGEVSLAGLNETAQMTLGEEDCSYGTTVGSKASLFHGTSEIVASASGGSVDPFELEARGLPEIRPDPIALSAGEAFTVAWTPDGTDATVRLYLEYGAHAPYPSPGAIICEVPDEAGEIVISESLVSDFVALEDVARTGERPAVISRWRESVIEPRGAPVALIVRQVILTSFTLP